jgi:hypothetical protein
LEYLKKLNACEYGEGEEETYDININEVSNNPIYDFSYIWQSVLLVEETGVPGENKPQTCRKSLTNVITIT